MTSVNTTPDSPPLPTADLPPGDHPLEIAARKGIGPLSPMGRFAWHGDAAPCVSCGQLVRRADAECGECGQDLRPEMLEKMRAHAGPWYVLEHVRPFPGVSLERIVRQIRRGLITQTSIVRGPATDYQWRFAVETPGLCRYFGRCWHCHGEVTLRDIYCVACLSHLTYEKPLGRALSDVGPLASASREPEPRLDDDTAAGYVGGGIRNRVSPDVTHRSDTIRVSSAPRTSELNALTEAVSQLDRGSHSAALVEPPRVLGVRATWVVVGLLATMIVTVLCIAQWRARAIAPIRPAATGLVMPIGAPL